MELNLYKIHLKLAGTLHPILWQNTDTWIRYRVETDREFTTDKHQKKFKKLQELQGRKDDYGKMAPTSVVHNLSSVQLDQDTMNALSKGFNFAVSPKEIPVEEIICGVENGIQKLAIEDQECVRQDVARILRKSKAPPPNIPSKELRALKKIKRNTDVVILPADKGNATVVMDASVYNQKMKVLLEDPVYKKIDTDPTTYLEKTTKMKIKNSSIDTNVQNSLIPREKSSRCPKLYGLPKIHKKDVPLRPIVSSVDSPLQPLAKHLARQLQPYAEAADSYIKNAQHFLEIISKITLEPKDILVSFDVVSLFTQIPVLEAVDIIKQKCEVTPDILQLIKHCLTNTYFIYDGERYRQTEGAPMGSPLSPVVANIFMDHFEVKALSSAPLKPRKWVRYVDDTFVVWPHGAEELTNFLNHLNGVHERIQFTMETEDANQLPFLDVLVKKKRNGQLGYTVYRKATHTNRYLHAHSHHHPSQLHSVIKTLMKRSESLSDAEHRKVELKQIQNALNRNGYSNHLIQKVMKKKQKKTPEIEVVARTTLPYVKNVTDKIGRVLSKNNVQAIFKPCRTVASLLSNPKEKIPLEHQGVYKIPCNDCDLAYIGQTNRKISARIEEHKNAIAKKQSTSALVQHINNTGHSINFQESSMLAAEKRLHPRIIREAIEIEKHENFNKRDDSQRLPSSWKTTINLIRSNKAINDSQNVYKPGTPQSLGQTNRTNQRNQVAGPPTGLCLQKPLSPPKRITRSQSKINKSHAQQPAAPV